MNILLIPANDWLRAPVPCRHHHIFDRIAETDDVHVFQFDLYPDNNSRETNAKIHRLPSISSKDLASYYFLNLFPYSRQVVSIVKSEKIDVVVVSNIVPGIPTLLPNLQNTKVVFDLKDMLSDIAAIYYGNNLLSSIIKGSSEWLLHRLLQRADHTVAVSEFLVQYLERLGISKVSLITNGVDLSIFKPNLKLTGLNGLSEKLEGNKVIGFVGTIDAWVDFETVIKSLKELSNRMDNIKLLIVGGKARSKYFDKIRSSVIEIGLKEKVIFTGFVPHNEVPHYINMMDVCLIPQKPELRLNQARCSDKLFEYLACGKPVVSSRLPEVLRIGRNAVKIYDDVSSLTETLTELLLNRASQTSVKNLAMNIAKNYDWSNIAAEYRKMLDGVLNE